MPNGASKDNRSTRYMQLGLGWIFVGAYAVENGRSIDIALLQGRRANKKLARGEVPPLLLKIDGIVGLETAFAFLKMAPDS